MPCFLTVKGTAYRVGSKEGSDLNEDNSLMLGSPRSESVLAASFLFFIHQTICCPLLAFPMAQYPVARAATGSKLFVCCVRASLPPQPPCWGKPHSRTLHNELMLEHCPTTWPEGQGAMWGQRHMHPINGTVLATNLGSS